MIIIIIYLYVFFNHPFNQTASQNIHSKNFTASDRKIVCASTTQDNRKKFKWDFRHFTENLISFISFIKIYHLFFEIWGEDRGLGSSVRAFKLLFSISFTLCWSEHSFELQNVLFEKSAPGSLICTHCCFLFDSKIASNTDLV